MYHNKTRQTGFTLIELLFAMTFVAFILIFISLTLIQMLRTYDKAIAMKQINQAGKSITEDIATSMRSQLPDSIKLSNVGSGVMCIGDTMYYWNPLYTGGTGLTGGPDLAGAVFKESGTVTPVNSTGSMMVKKTNYRTSADCSPSAATEATTFEPDSREITLLSNRSRVIWANVARVSVTGSRLFKVTFILGTYDETEFNSSGKIMAFKNNNFSDFPITPHGDTTTNNVTCLTGSDGDYCAFTKFSTIVYVSGDR